MPPYKLKLVDDSSNDDGSENDDESEIATNEDDKLENESIAVSDLGKEKIGYEKVALETTTEIDVDNICTAENKMDTVVEDKEEMENKILAENQSQITESEQSDMEQVKILQTDKKNEVLEIMDQNKVMQTTSENADLEGQNEYDKKIRKDSNVSRYRSMSWRQRFDEVPPYY